LNDRNQLELLVKKPLTLKHIVCIDFDNMPVFSAFSIDMIYFANKLDVIVNCNQNGTSIIKMSTKSLRCVEIYQSKFKIIHFAINTSKNLSENKRKLIKKPQEGL
jgi:hypothetical protein